jgi:hypothetical protein
LRFKTLQFSLLGKQGDEFVLKPVPDLNAGLSVPFLKNEKLANLCQ